MAKLVMQKLVDVFLNTLIPAEVWHYTNLPGFEGIISSGRIWATEARSTTDPTEFVHAREVAQVFLEGIEPKDCYAADAKRHTLNSLASLFETGVLSPSRTEIFVASFCATADLKSQWKNYGDHGCGVSLAFDLRYIRPSQRQDPCTVTFAPCLYKVEYKEQILYDALAGWTDTVAQLAYEAQSPQWMKMQLEDWTYINRIYGTTSNIKAFLGNFNEVNRSKLHKAYAWMVFDVLRIASHCKHKIYQPEAEWRLSLPHRTGTPMQYSTIQHRGQGHTTPYIAHNLFRKKLPLTHVKIGPLCEHEDRVKEVLQQYGYDIPVTQSRISLLSDQLTPKQPSLEL